jgi:hypothetical protein
MDYFMFCLEIQRQAVGKGGYETTAVLYWIGWVHYCQKHFLKAIDPLK